MHKIKVKVLLLATMVVSLVLFFVPYLKGHEEKNKTESTTVQEDAKCFTQSELAEMVENNENDVSSNNSQNYDNFNSEIEAIINEMNIKLSGVNNIENKEEWFISYKNVIQEYSDILDPPETIYDYFSAEELDLLFRIVQAEVGDEWDFIHKANVANVVFNRINSNKFANEMKNVLVADQFSTISNGRYKKVSVSETTILACEYAFIFGELDKNILFFDSNNSLKYTKVFNDGAHTFYK